ncbi:ABC transporter substrate-binding protein [Rhodococcus marinonascens]|uniref:ABC transporter substrate-binding protein n=1 Tax=Rhodococcus marinonascens TaxID=38311 RepID=UPI0009340D1E|nr:ABC transporter substrate-binding protein [Rhodococcus marinonascens]
MAHTRNEESWAGRRRRPLVWSRVVIAASALLLVGAMSSCGVKDATPGGFAGQVPGDIIVGAGDTAESRILAEIYAGALRSTGTQVSTDPGLGDRTAYLGKLDAGDVTLVPEFTGGLLRHYDPASTETEQDDVFEALSKSLPQGLSVSDFASAEDRSVLAITLGTSDRLTLATLDELVPWCSRSTVDLAPSFEADALTDLSGCAFAQTRTVADDAAAIAELAAPESAEGVRVAGVTTASPDVAGADLVVLSDADHVFTAQNVVPLYRTGSLGESQVKAMNVVAGELTTADLADMIGQVRGGADSVGVARVWREAHL